MTWRVIVGTLSLVLTMILLGYVAVTEQDRMANFTIAYDARQVEVGAALFENNCAACHGLQGEGSGRAPALNTPDLLVPLPGTSVSQRLQDIGWAGSIPDYIHATIAGGRPRPSVQYPDYPQRMPTWSQEFGGPLRADQINSLVDFIMNWAPAFANATPVPTVAITPVGTDITVALPAGDAARGEATAKSLGCPACHISVGGAATIGPNWMASGDPNGQGIGTRAGLRIGEGDYTGKATTAEQYLFESIVSPDAFIVPPASQHAPSGQSLMPHDYANKVSAEMMADLIAYLQTLK